MKTLRNLLFTVLMAASFILCAAPAQARNDRPLNRDVAMGAVKASILKQAEAQLQGTGVTVRSVGLNNNFKLRNTTSFSGKVHLSDGRSVDFDGKVKHKELRSSVESLGLSKNLPKDRQAQKFASRSNGYRPLQGSGWTRLPQLTTGMDLRPSGRISQPLKQNEVRLPAVRKGKADKSVLVKVSKVNTKTGTMSLNWGRQGRKASGRFTRGYSRTGSTKIKTDPRSWKGYGKRR